MAADDVISPQARGRVPLVVFQTGSGTQTNMNANESFPTGPSSCSVVSSAARSLCILNDHVNMSQSSNDSYVFPLRHN